jgi:hypothetical protein
VSVKDFFLITNYHVSQDLAAPPFGERSMTSSGMDGLSGVQGSEHLSDLAPA